jgi:hypothetical protein
MAFGGEGGGGGTVLKETFWENFMAAEEYRGSRSRGEHTYVAMV